MPSMNMENPQDFVHEIEKLAEPGILEEAVDAGLDIMRDSMKKEAKSHIYTGEMERSIEKVAVTTDKYNNIIGRVRFKGTSKVWMDKRNKKKPRKVNITNWLKAFQREYGTSKTAARPFVEPAIKKAEFSMKSAIQEKIDEGYKNVK